MNADGSGQHRLSDLYGQIPAWSPDGQYIAFEGHGGLTIMRTDGPDPTVLHLDIPTPEFPDWIS